MKFEAAYVQKQNQDATIDILKTVDGGRLPDEFEWTVRCEGDRISTGIDGKTLLEVRDSRLAKPGNVALSFKRMSVKIDRIVFERLK